MNDAAAMLQAVRDGDVSAVKRLLSEDPALVRATDDHLKTPLHWAAEHDHHDVAEMLISAGPSRSAQRNQVIRNAPLEHTIVQSSPG